MMILLIRCQILKLERKKMTAPFNIKECIIYKNSRVHDEY
jgi:hypothetical protein